MTGHGARHTMRDSVSVMTQDPTNEHPAYVAGDAVANLRHTVSVFGLTPEQGDRIPDDRIMVLATQIGDVTTGLTMGDLRDLRSLLTLRTEPVMPPLEWHGTRAITFLLGLASGGPCTLREARAGLGGDERVGHLVAAGLIATESGEGYSEGYGKSWSQWFAITDRGLRALLEHQARHPRATHRPDDH